MREKLLDLMKNEGLKAGQLAEMLGINPAGISHLLAGRNKPGFDLLQKILRRFPQISPDWLLLDKGPMYRESTTADGPASPYPHIQPPFRAAGTTGVSGSTAGLDAGHGTAGGWAPQPFTKAGNPEAAHSAGNGPANGAAPNGLTASDLTEIGGLFAGRTAPQSGAATGYAAQTDPRFGAVAGYADPNGRPSDAAAGYAGNQGETPAIGPQEPIHAPLRNAGRRVSRVIVCYEDHSFESFTPPAY